MPSDLFSATEITAWQHRLNNSAEFAEAAADWHGRLLLIEEDPTGGTRRAWLVIDHGQCAEARVGEPADQDSADYALAASPDTWSDLTAARTTPALAAMGGRLSLRKGAVMALLPHARAAAALLAAFAP
ncbi:MAG TPA: hypothetical protein VGM77_10555 [Gemmatimonadales bacterium]|jgi:putative sterol carrier protein